MRVTYDPETDSMILTLRKEPIRESDELGPGVIADFGHDGGIVRFEILGASRVVVDHARGSVRAERMTEIGGLASGPRFRTGGPGGPCDG